MVGAGWADARLLKVLRKTSGRTTSITSCNGATLDCSTCSQIAGTQAALSCNFGNKSAGNRSHQIAFIWAWYRELLWGPLIYAPQQVAGARGI